MTHNRNLLNYIVIGLKGIAMGAADVVPGVSGGTIAFISGIYEELITSINNVNLNLLTTFRKKGFKAFWNQLNGSFLVALFGGVFLSLFSLATAVSWLLEHQPILLWSFFFGLVVASVFSVAKAIERWHIASIIAGVLGAIIAYYITTLPPNENSNHLLFLFFSGALAVCAMILPGISGAFILVLLGSYKTILDAVHERDFKIIITVALGAVFGLLSFAKLLKWMFSNYKNLTLALLTGFIVGSLAKIWPWKKVLETKIINTKVIPLKEENIAPWSYQGDNQLVWAILLAIMGFALIFILEKVASKK
ncbi:DUF368 domain-containing protein [Arenibacter sp. GZD96]|uniref:DUF368 domain-containing protein n=1 Tax=Aurantibrevibacter litoralis TaxID=3106030 RepID=UPI002AFEFEE2|nr:DUF368 domain-containing protein [Arenibacter sp. GZD-96]MEA1785100.1 DUF368 domain-containing protein [Arenibacter sp. GZD-96]